jgi:hypothetical protein
MELDRKWLAEQDSDGLEWLHNDCRNREKAYQRAGLYAFAAMWRKAGSEVLHLQIERELYDWRARIVNSDDTLF